jgi:hypothetical protein
MANLWWKRINSGTSLSLSTTTQSKHFASHQDHLMVETDIFVTICGGHVTPNVMSSVSYPKISNISTGLKYFHICKDFTDVYSDSE